MLTSGLTMWVGRWGISYTANITPDSTTGIGAWTLENFTSTMRTGKHLGTGRMILPPMPFTDIAALNDTHIKALFTFVKSIPPINNRFLYSVSPNMLGSYAK